VIWENSVYPTEPDLAGNFIDGHADYSWKRNAVLVHSQTFNSTTYAMMKKYAKYLWVTDDVMPNPWDAYPTFMTQLFSSLIPAPPSTATVARLSTNITPVSYPGAVTTEQDLQTISVPAGTLATNGQALRIVAAGTFANQATIRTIRLYFGATQLALYQSGTGGPFNWQIDAVVWRLGATNQYSKGVAFSGTNNVSGTNQQSISSPAETLANPITIKTTGQSVAAQAATVVSNTLMVEFLP